MQNPSIFLISNAKRSGFAAQLLGKITSMGMIFVPSKEGLSHSPAEATDWEDIEAGANLLLHTLLELSSS